MLQHRDRHPGFFAYVVWLMKLSIHILYIVYDMLSYDICTYNTATYLISCRMPVVCSITAEFGRADVAVNFQVEIAGDIAMDVAVMTSILTMCVKL